MYNIIEIYNTELDVHGVLCSGFGSAYLMIYCVVDKAKIMVIYGNYKYKWCI